MNLRSVKLIICCLAIGMQIDAVYAQQASTSPSDAGVSLEQITVTAERREERLQDVPIAVVAVSGDSLKDRGINSLQDLQFSAPGLLMGNLSGYANPFLRGVGGDIISPQADQGVPTYVDGVYNPNNISNLTSLMGIERIEVLYGPQGTLFGRNAVGGAINITTLTPTQEFQSSATLGFGNYASKELSGYISGPITDKLAIGLYAADTLRDTYLSFIGPQQPLVPYPPYEQQGAVRLKGVYTATDQLKITASFEYQNMRSAESNAYRQVQPNAVGFALGAPLIIAPYTLAINGPDAIKLDVYKGSIKAEGDLGWSRLVAIASYQKTFNSTFGDIDGTQSQAVWDAGNLLGGSRNTTLELQLQSPSTSRIVWIGGLYAFKEHAGYDPLDLTQGSAISDPVTSVLDTGLQNTVSAAAFGQATIPLTDAMRLTVGGRYTWDKARFTGYSSEADTVPGTFNPGPNLPGSFVSYPEQSHSWDEFTPKASLDYRLGDTLVYGTFSKGFKAGTYNLNSPSSPGPVNPEVLTAYEIGSKSDILNGRIRLNAAAYFYNYSDLQVTSVLEGGITSLENAAKARIYGVDFTPAVAVVDGLVVSAGVSYNHSRYLDFGAYAGELPAAVGNTAASIDATGHTLDHAPKWTYNANVDYTYKVNGAGSAHAVLNFYRNGGFFWDAQNVIRQNDYNILNLTLGYTTGDGRWTTSLWGTNLTNTFYESAELTFGLGTVAFDAPPKMFGVKFTHTVR